MTDWTEILERLAAGSTPQDVLRSLQPTAERAAFKRCALVRTFDREIFDNVLAPVDEPDWPAFDDFVKASDVEPVPRAEGTYRLKDLVRADHWHAWWADGADDRTLPEEMRALTQRLAGYFRSTGRPRDLLAQLVLVDQRQALKLFGTLYDQADEQFDLARCQDLVDVLYDELRAPHLGPELIALRNNRSAYLKARSLWSNEYLQTGTFLEPSGTRAVYDALVDGDGPRVLEIHAPGGRGKTMELRWLVSRVLVPRHIPCTKSDFDYLDPVNATRYPWLVLLEAAAQLNQQLPEAPFNAFLENFGWATPLLRRRVTDVSRVAAASKRLRPHHATTVRKRFAQTFASAVGDRPVVMVFDTLEEVHLRPRHHLAALLELLTFLHDTCPSVRLVLSGRYSVAGTGLLPPVTERELTCFSTVDSQRYLEQFRHVGRSSVRAAIIEKAEGDPFKLALLADIVQQRPSLSPADIKKYDADLIYLVLRVIRRIEDRRVRWLLRYGVIPRTLSLEFVRDVMQRELRRVMSGNVEHDHPDDDVLPEELSGSDTTFPTDVMTSADQRLDLEELWAQLVRYAATSSWVNPVPGDPESLRFHPNVMVPMRRVIRRYHVYHSLHSHAVGYFERKAKADPDRWDRWMCEAIYHRFQAEGPAAAAYWTKALNAVDIGEPQRRAALAEEVLGRDYVYRDGTPRPWDENHPVITPETLVQARYELASAQTQLARMSGAEAADQQWSRAEENVSAVERAHQQLGTEVVPRWRMAYVRAALALKADELDEAQQDLHEALQAAGESQDAVRLRILLADVQLRRGDQHAPATYRAALRAARRVAPRNDATYIRMLIIKAYRKLGRLQEAMMELEVARRGKHLTAEQEIQLGLLAVDVGIAAGRYEWAAENARDVTTRCGDGGPAAEARVALESRRPLLAIERAASAERATGDEAATTTSVETAWGRELTGLAAGAVGRYGQALQALETARSLWYREGVLAAVARCHMHSAILQMREVGNLTVAQHHLNEAAHLDVLLGGTAWCRSRLARVELLGKQGRPYEAIDLVSKVVSDLRARPQLLVRAAVEGLAIGLPSENDWLMELLSRQLQLVTPASARIVLLRDLCRVPDLHNPVAKERLRELRPLLRINRDQLHETDSGLLNLTLAELDRLAGNRKAAEARLTEAHEGCRGLGTRFFVREWSQALDRLDSIGGAARPQIDEVKEFVKEFKDCPTLCGVFLVERAEALRDVNDHRQARALLRQAEPLLDQAAEQETQWHARLQKAMGERMKMTKAKQEAYLVTAGAVFDILGNAVRRYFADTKSERSGNRLEQSRGSVRLAMTADARLDVKTWIPPDIKVERTYRRALLDLDSLIDTFAERMQRDWRQVGNELGTMALPRGALEAMRTGVRRFDLRCDIKDARLNAIPWELVRRSDTESLVALDACVSTMYRALSGSAARRDEIRFVQTGLNKLVRAGLPMDGHLGEHTVEALKNYQTERGLQPDGELSVGLLSRLQRELASHAQPLVVLAQPKSTLSSPLQIYRKHGFEVVLVEDPTLDRLAGAVNTAVDSGRIPSVLHLSCGLRESSGGTALTFLAGGWEAEAFSSLRTTDEIPVTSVNRLLAGIPRREFRPLVVLDVERPSGMVDMIFYLLLRNAFAGDLFGLGRCAGVLGTGLAGDDGYELYDTMIRSLATGGSLGETATALRALIKDDERLDRVLQFAGAALYTHLPWLRLMLGGTDGDDR